MTRDSIQEDIVELLRDNTHVLSELCTGLGKTLTAIKAIDRYIEGGRFIWIVPNTVLIQNTKDDFIKHGFGNLIGQGDFICYPSLSKYVNNNYKICIKDESHWATSDKRLASLNQIKSERWLALSATIAPEVWVKLLTLGDFKKYIVTYEEAVNAGILPEIEMEVHSISLDNLDKTYGYKFPGQKAETLLTASEYYKVLDNKVKLASDKWKQRDEFKGNPQWLYNRMLQAGGARLNWLGEYKTRFLEQTIADLGDERMIIFCASKAQAHKLGGADAVSSDNTKTQNNKILEEFNEGLSNRIFCRSMLTEGINLKATPYAIVCGLGNKELRAVQIQGRLSRHISPKLILLVVAGTVDEKFLENSFKVNIYGERL